MTFYKIITAFTIALSVFPSSVFPTPAHIDEYDDEYLDDRPRDKYGTAIKMCRSYSDSLDWAQKCVRQSYIYEDAIKICGADNYRLYPITMWGIHITNYFGSYDYQRLIKAELHHIAGDMMHIAKLEKDKNYRSQVTDAMKYEFQKTWFEAKASHYGAQLIRDLKLPDMPEEYYNSKDNNCEAFIEMIGFFKRWDELQKTGLQFYDLSDLYSKINERYKHIYDKPYAKESLLRYRIQRKLNLFRNPTFFNKYDTRIYREAAESESYRMICASYQPPKKTHYTYNTYYGTYISDRYYQTPLSVEIYDHPENYGLIKKKL
ncbi:hypothetical protein IM40_08065 [Candidatus Paracaedimonas acanthamoebae]|nr:hypothetical protein IM40_08065 [Candidatus Paracaedimonas acanthamoebae]